ncbi:MAG: 50S ribosomal protein L13 [Bacilli bacterium]|nr:50S ribosomal protein L13 [Bacilli bacterium]MDD7314578.1 50S ribosomal protein L13 [Bacilli bacterium]MDY4052036.1 50S ribosomal protein L13 [Bacilli bacterium]
MRTTYMQTAENARENRKWYVIDAENLVLGRLSVAVATVLKGKHKPTFTPHIDGGDYVVVINAEKVLLTGNKLEGKKYYRHSQYAGGLKTRTAKEMFEKQPQKVVELAVRGMLPKGVIGDDMYRRLFVYVGPEHKQQAQKPEKFPLEVK